MSVDMKDYIAYQQGYEAGKRDASAAIEELKAIAHSHCVAASSYWEELEELKAQLPKRGEIVRCGECVHCYTEGFVHERNICEKHPELGNVPDDWFCADGEREVQDESAGSL